MTEAPPPASGSAAPREETSPDTPDGNPAPGRRALLGWAVLILLAGAGLRVWAGLTDFWLDEILTLDWPRTFGFWDLVASPLTRHDNNHVLNSWWLRAVELFGEPDHWLPYRLLAIVTGIIGAAAMGAIGWRRSPLEGLIALGLGSFSYVLIHYSSECRGYAPVCCFAALGWLALARGAERPGWPSAVLFWLCAVFGVLAHSTFAFAYIGFGVWSLALLWSGRRDEGAASGLRWLLQMHVVPALFLGLIYFLRIRGMVIGGGPEFGVPRALVNTMAHVVGWAWTRDWVGYVAAGVAVALVASECVLRGRERIADRPGPGPDPRRGIDRASLAFYVTVVLVTPLLTAFVLQPKIIYMRYFLVAMPFLLLLVAGLVARGFRCCRAGRVAAIALLLVLAGLNAWRLEGLYTLGRGQYLAALQRLVELDPGPPDAPITVRGNEDLHISRILGYYNRFLPRRLVYLEPDAAVHPDWFITELQVPLTVPRNPGDRISVRRGGVYFTLRGRFEYASMSGAHWYIFQRDR